MYTFRPRFKLDGKCDYAYDRDKNVSKWYGDFQVLRNLTHIGRKRRSCRYLCGPSGSGKSTLIKTVNALEPFQSGSIFVNGVDVGAPQCRSA